MAKDKRLKLPDDFLGTVRALLNTPPPPEREKAKRRMGKTAKKRRAGKPAKG